MTTRATATSLSVWMMTASPLPRKPDIQAIDPFRTHKHEANAESSKSRQRSRSTVPLLETLRPSLITRLPDSTLVSPESRSDSFSRPYFRFLPKRLRTSADQLRTSRCPIEYNVSNSVCEGIRFNVRVSRRMSFWEHARYKRSRSFQGYTEFGPGDQALDHLPSRQRSRL